MSAKSFSMSSRLLFSVGGLLFGMPAGALVQYWFMSQVTVQGVLAGATISAILAFLFPRVIAALIELVTAGA